MIELYFIYNGHCQFFLGTFNNVDDLMHSRLSLTQGSRSILVSGQHDLTTVLRIATI